MTDRLTVDQINSDQLDHLYDRVAAAEQEADTSVAAAAHLAALVGKRSDRTEKAAKEQRQRADIAETELRTLRAGLRANGADPTQIQNLWAQISLRNRQWREEKQHAAQTETERDGAYRERAHLVALLAAMTPGAVIAPAPDVDESGWQIVYLTIGDRQASWHISPRDAELFAAVEVVQPDDPRAQWDGHTTEEKYAGIAAYTAELMQRCGPECSEMHRGGFRCTAGRG